MLLQRTAESHLQTAAKLLKEFGLSPTQYNVLRILRGANEEGLTCTQVSDRLITRDSDVTRLLDRMEARGWVKRERLKSDRRVVVARIAGAGLELVNSIDKPIRKMHKEHIGKLGPAKLEALEGLLEEARLCASDREEVSHAG